MPEKLEINNVGCFCNLLAGGDNCTTIKDSKHRLQDGTRYLAVYYSGGPDIFIQ